jgi:hypothetical protein
MREASAEKDLKRLLGNVSNQLDLIKRGYITFGEAQSELVKQYPKMVNDELKRYQNALYAYFSIQIEKGTNESIEKNEKTDQLDDNKTISCKFKIKEVLTTERGTQLYVTEPETPVNEQSQISIAKKLDNTSTYSFEKSQYEETNESDILALDELIPNTKENLFGQLNSKSYLKHSVLVPDLINNARDLY